MAAPADRFTSSEHTLLSRTAGNADRTEVVLVHGVGLGAASLRPLASALESSMHVTWIELPGFGRTPPQDPLRLMAEQSDFLANFLRSRGIAAAVLVGHSMGAGVVAGVAARHPDLVSRVVLIGPVTDPRARSRVKQGMRLIRDTCLEPPSTNRMVLREYARCGLRRYLIALTDMLRFDMEHVAGEIEQPVLIVRGSHDPIAPRAWCESLVERFPSARLVHIAGGAHVVLHSHPNRVAAAVRAFASDQAK